MKHGRLWSICKWVWKNKTTFEKVEILPIGACAVFTSKQGCFAGMLMNPQATGLSESCAVAKRTHLDGPVHHSPVKVAGYRFSAWMWILCDQKNPRELERSLDILQSILLARTKPTPKWPWQIFAEGIWPRPPLGELSSRQPIHSWTVQIR